MLVTTESPQKQLVLFHSETEDLANLGVPGPRIRIPKPLSFLPSSQRDTHLSPPCWVSSIRSSLQKPIQRPGAVFKPPSFPFCLARQHRFLVSFLEWERKIKRKLDPIEYVNDARAFPGLLPQHLHRSFRPLARAHQDTSSSPRAKGHFNLLADGLWAHTEAANSVKHAECVEQEGRGHDTRCLYSFCRERNRQDEAHLLLWAPFPAGKDHWAQPHHPWWLH